MVLVHRFRVVVALTVALLALGTAAAPVGAESTLVNCAGTCGYYQYYDDEPPPSFGANCKYETGSYDLDFMSGKPPLMHGTGASKTEVAWRLTIWRSTNSGGAWSKIHTSAWDTAKANNAIPARAGQGFARIYWYAPESPTGWFKMRVELRWKNGAGNVIGRASAEYNSYKGLWNGNSNTRMDHCIEDW